jgi:glutathione S-transferase
MHYATTTGGPAFQLSRHEPFMTARLISIPFSHYCEKARWALDRRGIAFVEEGHLPILHTRATKPAGGRSTPLLVVAGGPTLTDSTDILRWADDVGTRGERLFPVGDPDASTLEDRFDEVLGPHARRLGYFFLLDHDPALVALLASAPVPAFERRLAGATIPLVKFLLRRGLKITPAGAARSRSRIEEVFSEVEERLRDGRQFLTGDAFTAADLTFASLAAPLVIPPQYEQRLIPLSSTGPAFCAEVEGWRKTPAGKFALHLFAAER